MRIPYGTSDFSQIRRGGFFYVDKTPFLRTLERAEAGYAHLVFLRPRRFGKSTLLSLLDAYYDIGKTDRFEELFKGLWIHDHPTDERNSYLILSFDFSQVAVGRLGDAMLRTFFEAIRSGVEDLILAYRERVPELRRLDERLSTFQDAEALMAALMRLIRRSGHKLYILIDEYDHFANRLLAAGSQDIYESIVSEGFVRSFYATLKAGVGSGAVGRMFISGVTPLMLDDLSSGFNIVSHVSQDPELNTLAGFTRADVERAVDEFRAARPELAAVAELADRGRLLDVLEQYYNGYRFSPQASERVFNSDMVLYFLNQIDRTREFPADMLDQNVRTDYQHLNRIGSLSGAAAGERRELLESVLLDGHIRSDIVRQFGVKGLSSRASYASLLCCLGMLTISSRPRDAEGYDLEVPNRVIRELQWEHLALMLSEEESVSIETSLLNKALKAMAVDGEIEPFLGLFHAQVLKAFGVKDTRRLDERTVKLLFMMYVSLGRAFHPLSEKEFAQGYCDLFLGASTNVPGARYSWLLEFKYLKAGATSGQVESAFSKAAEQVARYASDDALLPLLLGDRALRAGMIVFLGTKKILFRSWAPGAKKRARS